MPSTWPSLFYELSLGPIGVEQLFYWFGLVPARYSHPEWARTVGLPPDEYLPFLTSMFLHGGWLHLIGNMWTLWIFGDNVEDRMGHARFLAFYLLTGLAAGLTHWFTNIDSIVPTVGASGAIAGVLGAYFILFPHARIIAIFPVFFFPFFFELPAGVYLLFWGLSQIFSGTLSTLAAADVGGWLGGCTSAALFRGCCFIGSSSFVRATVPGDSSGTRSASKGPGPVNRLGGNHGSRRSLFSLLHLHGAPAGPSATPS